MLRGAHREHYSAYAFSPLGNRQATANGLNQLATVGGVSYTYDGRGNLTSDGSRSFTYDVDNRLTSASAPTQVTLAYDPLGRLQSSTTGAGVATTFLFDGNDLVGEYDAAGNILNRYVPGPGTDEPLVWYAGAGTAGRRWLHADPAGSIVGWSDGAGASGAIQAYGPWGEPSSGWSGSRHAYTGQLMIPEAHLYFYKARVYDPGIGRFLQTDPIGYQSDINAYAYVGGDPVNYRDPSGESYTSCDEHGNCITTVDEVVVTARRNSDFSSFSYGFRYYFPDFYSNKMALGDFIDRSERVSGRLYARNSMRQRCTAVQRAAQRVGRAISSAGTSIADAGAITGGVGLVALAIGGVSGDVPIAGFGAILAARGSGAVAFGGGGAYVGALVQLAGGSGRAAVETAINAQILSELPLPEPVKQILDDSLTEFEDGILPNSGACK